VDVNQFKEEGNIEFLKQKRGGLRFMPDRIFRMGIQDVKSSLIASGISCRNNGSALHDEQSRGYGC
jgi:hypothetical protein